MKKSYKRRNFIKNAGIAGIGLAITSNIRVISTEKKELRKSIFLIN